MRVDESWWSNASESYNSHLLSSSFDWALTLPVEVVQLILHESIGAFTS